MNILSSIKRYLPALRNPHRNSQLDTFLANYGWIFQNNNKSTGEYNLYKYAERNVYIYRCIQVISDTLLINGFSINNTDENNVDYETTQYLYNVFNNPQGYDSDSTYAMFHKQYINSFELTGDAFIEVDYDNIDWDKDQYRVLSGFQFIPPNLIRWFEDTEQWGYRDKPGIRYESSELIHIYEPGINLEDMKYGESKLEKIRIPILMLYSGLLHNQRVLDNEGIDTKAILSFDANVSDESFTRELERLSELDEARRKGGTLAVKGASFQSGGLNNSDMDFLNLMGLCRDMIITAYGVQPSKLGIRETASLGSGTGESQDKDFKDGMNAKARIIEGAFNKVLGRNGFQEVFQFNEMDIEDKLKRTQIEDNKLKNGVVTINEVRSDYGLEPVEWGDVPQSQQSNNVSQDNITSVADFKRYKNNLYKSKVISQWTKKG